jgi:hypothetical protein
VVFLVREPGNARLSEDEMNCSPLIAVAQTAVQQVHRRIAHSTIRHHLHRSISHAAGHPLPTLKGALDTACGNAAKLAGLLKVPAALVGVGLLAGPASPRPQPDALDFTIWQVDPLPLPPPAPLDSGGLYPPGLGAPGPAYSWQRVPDTPPPGRPYLGSLEPDGAIPDDPGPLQRGIVAREVPTTPQQVPEPSTLILLVAEVVGLFALRRASAPPRDEPTHPFSPR